MDRVTVGHSDTVDSSRGCHCNRWTLHPLFLGLRCKLWARIRIIANLYLLYFVSFGDTACQLFCFSQKLSQLEFVIRILDLEQMKISSRFDDREVCKCPPTRARSSLQTLKVEVLEVTVCQILTSLALVSFKITHFPPYIRRISRKQPSKVSYNNQWGFARALHCLYRSCFWALPVFVPRRDWDGGRGRGKQRQRLPPQSPDSPPRRCAAPRPTSHEECVHLSRAVRMDNGE